MGCGPLVAVGLHLASWHSADWYSGRTPGLYARAACGAQVGVYRNSERRATAYAAYVLEARSVPLFLFVGLATGYASYPVPMVMPGVKVGPVRIAYAPKIGKANDSHVVHFAIEKGF